MAPDYATLSECHCARVSPFAISHLTTHKRLSSDHPHSALISLSPYLVHASHSFLYLGSQNDADDQALLDSHDISTVLNVASAGSQPPSQDTLSPCRVSRADELNSQSGSEVKRNVLSEQYLGLNVRDEPDYDLSRHFPECYKFIETARQEGRRVLVHCRAGVSRSVCIVAMYLLVAFDWTLAQVITYTVLICVKPSHSFTLLNDFVFSRSLSLSLSPGSTTSGILSLCVQSKYRYILPESHLLPYHDHV